MLYLKLVLTAVFWGGTFVAGRMASFEAGPFTSAFLRFAMASCFLFAFLYKETGTLPSFQRKNLLFIVLLGLTGVFAYNAFFFAGLKIVPAGRASLIIASNPAFIALFSCLVFRERLRPSRLFGIILSIAGAVVVIAKGNPAHLLQEGVGVGELLIFGCVLSWVSYSLIGKAAMRNLSPLAAVTYSCAFGAVCLFFPALFEGLARDISKFSAQFWLAIFFLAFFGSALGFVWYYEGIQALGPSRAGVFINIVPVSSIISAYLLLNESIDTSVLFGAVLVIGGVYLTNRSPACPRESLSSDGKSCVMEKS